MTTLTFTNQVFQQMLLQVGHLILLLLITLKWFHLALILSYTREVRLSCTHTQTTQLNTLIIIDSGVNNHICSSFNFFSYFHKIKHIIINLPNGYSVKVHVGNIIFSSKLHLTNVLYSPDFKLNLILVSKLYQTLSCNVKLFDKCYFIQDMNSLSMISLVKQNG